MTYSLRTGTTMFSGGKDTAAGMRFFTIKKRGINMSIRISRVPLLG